MKSLALTVLLNLLFAAVGLLGNYAGVAEASTDVNQVYISTLTSRVVVTTGTSVRIDNWMNGVQGTVLQERTHIQWQNLDAADDIYCLNNNSSVSTDTANANIGFKYTPGTFASEGIAAGVSFGQQTMWCRAVDAAGAAGAVIVTRQVRRN